MASTVFCSNCQRSVQLEEEADLICPVCSSPLVEAPNEDEQIEPKSEAGNRATSSHQREERVPNHDDSHRIHIQYPEEVGWEHLESG